MESGYIKIIIEILIFIGAIIGGWYALKFKVETIASDLKNLHSTLNAHEELTPICNKRFEDLKLDMAKLKTEEHMKSQYQREIVESILSPTLKELTLELKAYVNAKTGILTREIELFKIENQVFKGDMKEYIKELKEENGRSIDRIVTAIESKKS